MPATIQIKNELDLQDFAEAERITPARGHGFYRFMYAVTRFNLFAVLLLFPLFLLFAFSEVGGIHSWNDAGRLVLVLALVGTFFGARIKTAWKDRYGNAVKRMNEYKYRVADTITISGSGIEMLSGISDALNCSLAWVEFVGFHEGPRIFLVIQKGSHQELLIPKRYMTESEQTETRELLQRNVGNW